MDGLYEGESYGVSKLVERQNFNTVLYVCTWEQCFYPSTVADWSKYPPSQPCQAFGKVVSIWWIRKLKQGETYQPELNQLLEL